MTVGKRIGGGFLFSVVLIAVIGATGYRSLHHLVETAAVVTHTEDVLRNLEATISALKDVETGRRGYIITGEDSYLEPYRRGIAEADALVATVRKLTQDAAQQQGRLNAIEGLIADVKRFSREVIDARKAGGFAAGQEIVMTGRGKQIMDEMRKVVAEMRDEETAVMRERQAESDAAIARAKIVLVGGSALAAILLAVCGAFITRDIAQPLGEVTAAAARISEGDINVDLADSGRSDEIGVLMATFRGMCRSLNVLAERARQIASGDLTAQIHPRSERDVLGTAFADMVTELRRVMEELLDAANVLAGSASDIMASTRQLAASAAETAAAVTETTATVEEVKQTSQVSSGKAREVADEARKAAEVAQVGKAAVDRTLEGMSGIREQMVAVAESILNLSAQGQAIGEIIASVDDLAAQSKLLAVNAAIEAAKAGDEGRGFAVVAQEVRSLAEQSKSATLQVRAILNDIQKATSSAVLTTEQGGKAVEAGVVQAGASGDSIGTLAASIEGAARASSQIAATSQQQFVGMEQVAMAMENIKGASTQTLASTRQAESAAQQLNQLGQKLRDLVARFKV